MEGGAGPGPGAGSSDVPAPPYGAKVYSARTSPGNKLLVVRLLQAVPPRVLLLGTLCLFAALLYLGALAHPVVLATLTVCLGCFAFAAWLAQWVLAKDEGPAEFAETSNAIRDGAEGFFATQYGTISSLSVVLAVAIFLIYATREPTREQREAGISALTMATFTAGSFLLGALCSGVAGYTGMWVSVRANVRVSAAARRSAREPLVIALRAGGFSALLVVAMTMLGISSLFAICCLLFGVGTPGGLNMADVSLLLVGYGFGASFVALFAQLGGGIYTKAADVGADLVGKLEASLPEDDPRNPATIADLVGDNVGDCAARGADLFESIAAEVISAMILGGTMAKKSGLEESAAGFILFPLVVHSMDLLVSAIGFMAIRPSSRSTRPEDPMEVIKKGYTVSVVLAVIGFVAACRVMLYTDAAPGAWLNFAGCGLVGIATAYAFVFISQFYTDYKYSPVRRVAEASTTGHGTNVIAGMALGLESTAMPVFVISIAIIASYWLGRTSGLVDEHGSPTGGLFGTAVATMGMLSTAVYVLTMDIFGPIADNAGGIVEMSQQPEEVREVTDLLDAVGNTTKATTKGFAIGSAALACFLLFSAFMDECSSFSGVPFTSVDIAVPEVFIGGLLGAMLVFLFSSMAFNAVGRSAQEVVTEVRRQLSERPGIMTFQERPDYARCVSIVARSALREMVKPGLTVVIFPIATGVGFKLLGDATNQPLLGAKAVAGMLMFATVTGILMALYLNTAGGAWDNAKKYIEQGAYGGKNSEAHKASITGDTVGDPAKDTAGPSIHVLIKLLATITLVMCPLFL